MARVYDLVARHFIASVSHDAVWRSTTVRLSIDELDEKGQFTIRGKSLQTPGFLAIMLHRQYGDGGKDGQGKENDEEERDLPHFIEGDQYGLFFSASKKVSVYLYIQSTHPSLASELSLIVLANISPTRFLSHQPVASFAH